MLEYEVVFPLWLAKQLSDFPQYSILSRCTRISHDLPALSLSRMFGKQRSDDLLDYSTSVKYVIPSEQGSEVDSVPSCGIRVCLKTVFR